MSKVSDKWIMYGKYTVISKYIYVCIYAGYMYFYGEQRVLSMKKQFTSPSTRLYSKLKNGG